MKLVLRLVVVLLAVALLGAGGFYAWLLRSLPRTEGEVKLAGLRAPVEILRDPYGIPHIYARSVEDAVYALGFVHAQDRLWQMEIDRRIGAGRLSEIVGPAGLKVDRFIRTIGVRRAAQANFAHLDVATQRLLEAYAAGVNAYLATDPVLPPEFWILRDKPEAWTPVDSIVWTKMMAWDLSGNWRNELLRMELAAKMPNSSIEQFLPPYPGDAPTPLPNLHALYRGLGKDAARLALAIPGGQEEGAGSNNWVVSGAHTATGKPLLANDPHLGLTAPPVWYFAHLHAPGLDAIGATLPGVPAIVLGRNDRIAWGFTNTGPDVQDLYIEKLEGADGYLTPAGPRPFKIVDETIKVRGAPDETLRVRISRHGPVISDLLPEARRALPGGHVIAFQWTALADDDTTMRAALGFARAGNWKEFLAAARDFETPEQNMVYADVDGNIGFVAAGRVPVRKPDNDLKGLAPAPGWDARYDWAGYIPFDDLPRKYNPAGGEIVTANNKIVPKGYPFFITSEWQPPYRADRIRSLLDAVPKHTVPSFARMQADTASLPMRAFVADVKNVHPASEDARRALAMLETWDGTMAVERPEPLIAEGWWRELTREIYADELGEDFAGNWKARAPFVLDVLANRNGAAHWCDDVRTPAKETCAEILSRSLEVALSDLRRRYGNDMRDWRWGQAHFAHLAHRPFSAQPLLARFFDIRVPSPGGTYTVDVGRNNLANDAEPFASNHAPSLRAIYDLSNPDNSLFIHSGGQSGNPLSDRYAAFTRAWARNEYIPMITDRRRIEAGGVRRLVLDPAH